MRLLARFCVVGVVAFGLAGCDGGSDLKEGTPKDIDMSKDYSPKVDMPGMGVKAMKKAKAETAPATTAPATDPSK